MHIIQSIRAELRATSRAAAVRAGDQLSQSVRDDLPELLSALLDGLVPAGEVLRIDELDVDLGVLPPRTDSRDLALEIATHVKKAVQRQWRESSTTPRPVEIWNERYQAEATEAPERSAADHEPLEAFLFYLERGSLPWWFSLERWRDEIPESLLTDRSIEHLESRLVEVVKRSPHVLMRLLAFPELVGALVMRRSGVSTEVARRLPPSVRSDRLVLAVVLLELSETRHGVEQREALGQLVAFLRRFVQQDEASAQAGRSLLGHFDFALERESTGQAVVLRALLGDSPPGTAPGETGETQARTGEVAEKASLETAGVSAGEQNDPGAEEAGVAIRPESGIEATEGAESPEVSSNEEPLSDLLATDSAGIVLLHPWLPNLFRTLGWLDEGDRFLQGREWFGAQALFVLSQGRPAGSDAELVLEKTMCGIPLAHAADLPVLDEGVQDELHSLLTDVIRNWPVLRNTSPDGLRESFLQRSGLLNLSAKPPELRIETRAYDLLLDRLPWSIDPVVLPWLPHPLKVTWPPPH